MKNLNWIWLLGLVLSAFTPTQAAKVTFKVAAAPNQSKVILDFNATGERREVIIDSLGQGSIELGHFTPQYVTMQYTRGRRNIYLDPKQDVVISFNSANMWKETQFEGPGAAINNYLASGKLKSLGMPDMKMEESVLIQYVDSLFASNMEHLLAAQLPADFTKQEKERLLYQTYFYFPMYALYHGSMAKKEAFKPSSVYYSKLNELLKIDADLLLLKEYQTFLPNAISVWSSQDGEHAGANTTVVAVNYIDAQVSDAKVAEFLINDFVYNYVDRNGLDDADLLLAMYNKHVSDPKLKEPFATLCTRWEKLRSGQPSPTFTYSDIGGNPVSLTDLKGKYVYIDVWATWCGPCRGEIPALKELEHAFAGQDIHFVSISTDKDKKAWEKMVQDENLKGIQLHIDGDRSFMNAYFVTGIPRFILIDRAGHIVSATMTRPSNPKTAERFKELLSK